MQKPDSLRAALTAAIVDGAGAKLLERDPDKLKIYLDKGRIAARMGAGGELGYEWRYRCIVLLEDYAGDPDAVILPVIVWLLAHQPELVLNHQRGNEAIAFEADIIDAKTVDLELQLELSEPVQVAPRVGGGFDVVHLAEPAIEAELAGVPAGTLVGEIYAGGELIASIAP